MARSARTFLDPGTTSGPFTDTGLLILRLGGGLLLAFLHGWGKVPPSDGFVGMIDGLGFPAPMLFAWLAAIAEFAGGLMIAVGLFSRPVAAFVSLHFLFVVFVAHAGDTLGGRELPIIFLVIAATVMLTGPGRFSLDAMFGRKGSEQTDQERAVL